MTPILAFYTEGALSDAAITNIVTGTVTIFGMILGFLGLWVKLHYGVKEAKKAAEAAESVAKIAARKVESVEEKIDHNTEITKAATKSANAAAVTATRVAASLEQKLNGGIDSAVNVLVEPVKRALSDHDIHMKDVEQGFITLANYLHERNHEVLGALQVNSNKLGLILEYMKDQNKTSR